MDSYDGATQTLPPNGGFSYSSSTSSSSDDGWQTVTYAKKNNKRVNAAAAEKGRSGSAPDSKGNEVFAAVEQKAKERRRAIELAAAAARENEDGSRSRIAVGDDEEESDEEEGIQKENGRDEVKKVKKPKVKKPKVTVAEAASKIDADDLAAFLVDVTNSYEANPEIQLMRFADYFARAFNLVNSTQFLWTKLFKESPIVKLIDVPICYVTESVYKTAVNWIAQQPVESLGTFVLWSLDNILDDLVHQQASSKGSKKSTQQLPSKAQVAIFVVLAMTLRRKPDVLVNLLPSLKDKKYQGHDKFPVIVWMIAQASQGDLVVGMYAWVRYLLPFVYGKSSPNTQSRDLLLQLVERFLSNPKARPILLNGAIRKGERLVTPSALELLWQQTFPEPSARIKSTDRFEAVYPTLKEIALSGSTGSKAMKPVAQQLLSASLKAMRSNNPQLGIEASNIFIWCLTQTVDCFKQWEQIYVENIDASVIILKKLSNEWKEHAHKFSPDMLRETIKNLRMQTEEVLEEDEDNAHFIEAEKYCKVILGRLNRRSKCMKSLLFVTVAVAVGAVVALGPNVESWDINKLYKMINLPQVF